MGRQSLLYSKMNPNIVHELNIITVLVGLVDAGFVRKERKEAFTSILLAIFMYIMAQSMVN